MNSKIKLLTISVLLISSIIYAQNVTRIVAFGDSLSDTGNNGRYSDGALWLEVLAEKLHLPPPQPSSAGGLNFSYSGAMSGNDISPDTVNVGNQIKTYLKLNDGKADPDTLYIIWVGGNDFLDKRNPLNLIDNIADHVETLIDAGATRFFVPNLPSLVHAPKGEQMINEMVDALLQYLHSSFEFVLFPIVKQCCHEGLHLYNLLLECRLKCIENSRNIVIHHLDVFSMFNQLLEDLESHGFSHKSDLFYDPLHPSSKGHGHIADFALSKIQETLKTKSSAN